MYHDASNVVMDVAAARPLLPRAYGLLPGLPIHGIHRQKISNMKYTRSRITPAHAWPNFFHAYYVKCGTVVPLHLVKTGISQDGQ
jgi:hypothetical protein